MESVYHHWIERCAPKWKSLLIRQCNYCIILNFEETHSQVSFEALYGHCGWGSRTPIQERPFLPFDSGYKITGLCYKVSSWDSLATGLFIPLLLLQWCPHAIFLLQEQSVLYLIPLVFRNKLKSAWGQFHKITVFCKLKKEFRVFTSILKCLEQKQQLVIFIVSFCILSSASVEPLFFLHNDFFSIFMSMFAPRTVKEYWHLLIFQIQEFHFCIV